MSTERTPLTDPTPWGLVLLLGSLSALGPLAVDMYLPSLPAITHAFHASPAAVSATLATYFAGLGLGQFVFGPLSDRLGRRWPVVAGVLLYLAASAVCALAPSIVVLIVARFFQAVGGSAGQAVGRASVRDRFSHRMAARILSLLMLVMGVAPIVAPLFGGYLLVVGDWRVIFWVQAGAAAAILVAVLLGFAETHPHEARRLARGESVWRSYRILLSERRVVGFALAGAFNSGAMVSWISLGSYLIIEVYGVSPQNFGWWFSSIAVVFIGLSQVNAHLLRWWTPEEVLVRARLISMAFVFVLVADAYTGFGGIWGVMAPLYVTIGSFGLVNPNTMAAAMNVDPSRTGAISSIVGGASFGMGAIISPIGGLLHDGTARPMATLIFVMIFASSAALYLVAKPLETERLA